MTKSLFGLMAKSLGIDQEIMFDLFRDDPQRLKFNYYPPCPKAEKVIGLSPHTDACGLTILLQVNEVNGLQIKKDGKWFPVAPLPGSFIVNVGDIIEVYIDVTQYQNFICKMFVCFLMTYGVVLVSCRS